MNKDKILIVSALIQEIPDWELNTGHNIIYTGVGKVNATYSLLKALQRKDYDLIINYGTAGSRNIPIHTLVDCTQFVQRDIDTTPLGFKKGYTPFEEDIPARLSFPFSAINNPIRKNLTCGTGDNFVQNIDDEIKCDVFDMEAYSLAKICWKDGKDFVSYKYITDNANDKSADDWDKNCGKGVKELKKVLEFYDSL
tara:strand:- start:1083 stop:1670 length:588 start_codon:yes stop_codon:yes gene_type:complete